MQWIWQHTDVCYTNIWIDLVNSKINFSKNDCSSECKRIYEKATNKEEKPKTERKVSMGWECESNDHMT